MQVLSPGVKPLPWNFGKKRGGGPKWDWFHDSVSAAAPLLSPVAAHLYTRGGRLDPASTNMTLDFDARGAGLLGDATADDTAWDDNAAIQPLDGNGFSVAVTFRLDLASGTQGLVARRSSFGAGYWGIYASTAGLSVALHDGGFQAVSWGNQFVAGQTYTLVWAHDGASTYRFLRLLEPASHGADILGDAGLGRRD